MSITSSPPRRRPRTSPGDRRAAGRDPRAIAEPPIMSGTRGRDVRLDHAVGPFGRLVVNEISRASTIPAIGRSTARQPRSSSSICAGRRLAARLHAAASARRHAQFDWRRRQCVARVVGEQGTCPHYYGKSEALSGPQDGPCDARDAGRAERAPLAPLREDAPAAQKTSASAPIGRARNRPTGKHARSI